jgi:hypothetical protein
MHGLANHFWQVFAGQLVPEYFVLCHEFVGMILAHPNSNPEKLLEGANGACD